MYGSLRLKVLRIGMQRFHHSPCGGVNMKSFVVEHLDSIRYIDDLNEATKSILFITFLLNSIKVASVLFPLMAVKSLSALAFPAIFSSMLVAEVFYLGWICNEVKEQSLKISTDAYKILWYNENKDVSVLLQMMIRRAQRPLTMQMGPFGPMVTDTILSTMKAAYSYTTLMLNARE
uniref:Odorant receptor 5 n=1 Tax=Dendroctonus ponderosae TaxID=77166 RepID=A0A0H3W5L6_DENPD|nr:odorant receptor 5 [Dendroctonus ponderosae]